MKRTLGFYTFIRNATKYDYPLEESLLSILPVADEIVICECYSEDDTFNRVVRFAEDHGDKNIKIVQKEWVKDFRGLSKIGNFAADHLHTDWIWQMQADEVLHEDFYEFINSIKKIEYPIETCYNINYYHFLGNYETEFDFMYRKIRRLARDNYGWELTGDACQLDGGEVMRVKDSPIYVYHYGKVHSGEVGFLKETDFQNLFTEIGFPDPKLKIMEEKLGKKYCDYVYLFEKAIKAGEARKFTGTHPKVMEERIKKFKESGWEQFQSVVNEQLKIERI